MKIKVTNCFRLDHSATMHGDNTLGFTDFSVQEFDDLREALSYYNSEMELWMLKLQEFFWDKSIAVVDVNEEKSDNPILGNSFTYISGGCDYTYFMPTISYGKPASV